MIIDSHHHFWNYDPVEYDWIDDSMSCIRRSFLPADLKSTIDQSGVNGVVTVQARQSLEETDWLLGLAQQNEFIKGVVGWLPLADDNFGDVLAKYASNSALKSLRHVVQGEADDNFILRPDFNRGISQLQSFNLAYDILIFERHLPQTLKFVDMHPNQVFVLDHIAKPKIGQNILSPWRENMIELGKRPNVYCKISGMVTEADYQSWSEQQLQPYFDVVLNAFGADRLMFGSDWPVCLVGVQYAKWLSLVRNSISQLSDGEQSRILGLNAVDAYRLA